jgi:branched-chain amino acid transport system permease protein
MDAQLFLVQLINGLQLGVLLFLVAAGLTLVFGIMDFVNLAHGAFYMVGAYICALLAAKTGHFLPSLLLSLPLVFVLGLLVEKALVSRLYNLSHLDHVLATFGLILVFDTLTHYLAGPDGEAILLPAYLNGAISAGGISLPVYRILIISVGLIVAAALAWGVNRTRAGMLLRAGASDREMTSALGVNIDKLYRLIFATGAMLAGLAGALIAPISGANIAMGNEIIIIALVVVVIGGIGSIKGAFLGALFVGLIDTMGRAYMDDALKLFISPVAAESAAPALSAMIVYIVMATVLAFRPNGLFPINK